MESSGTHNASRNVSKIQMQRRASNRGMPASRRPTDPTAGVRTAHHAAAPPSAPGRSYQEWREGAVGSGVDGDRNGDHMAVHALGYTVAAVAVGGVLRSLLRAGDTAQ